MAKNGAKRRNKFANAYKLRLTSLLFFVFLFVFFSLNQQRRWTTRRRNKKKIDLFAVNSVWKLKMLGAKTRMQRATADSWLFKNEHSIYVRAVCVCVWSVYTLRGSTTNGRVESNRETADTNSHTIVHAFHAILWLYTSRLFCDYLFHVCFVPARVCVSVYLCKCVNGCGTDTERRSISSGPKMEMKKKQIKTKPIQMHEATR